MSAEIDARHPHLCFLLFKTKIQLLVHLSRSFRSRSSADQVINLWLRLRGRRNAFQLEPLLFSPSGLSLPPRSGVLPTSTSTSSSSSALAVAEAWSETVAASTHPHRSPILRSEKNRPVHRFLLLQLFLSVHVDSGAKTIKKENCCFDLGCLRSTEPLPNPDPESFRPSPERETSARHFFLSRSKHHICLFGTVRTRVQIPATLKVFFSG